jgi:hypothetical protein
MSDVGAACAIKLPDRDELRREFDAAVQELLDKNLTNPLLKTQWYSSIGDSVFDACYRALEDACDPKGHKGFPGTPYAGAKEGRLHVVSAPVGSGKTSFSIAFIVAMITVAERNEDAAYGCLFVAEQIIRADQIYDVLNKLLPGKVAVWTTEHDPKCKVRIKELKHAGKYSKEQLKEYPVAVVTHAFFHGKGGYKARQVFHRGHTHPRALTVIDERIEEVIIYDVELSAAQSVRELVQKDENVVETIGPHLDALVDFMHQRSLITDAGNLEKPTTAIEAWTKAERDLQWFNTPAASAYAKANGNGNDIQAVFGFAKALATGYAFINRQQGTHYIGYQSNLVVAPGTVLLDATSDIDGISQLCPWREHQEVPHARYDNLKIVHVPAHTNKNLSTYLKAAKNRRDYVDWLIATIKQHMEPGQRGLIVVKKALIDNENVPTWPIGDPRHSDRKLFTEEWGWDLEGRKLCVIHWGTGIGDNAWKDADVVLLCDDFYLPKRTVIATAQGLRNHKSTEGALGAMSSHNTKAPAVDILQDGHILRCLKQMALRGQGRCYDERGICGHQKLIYSGNLKKLLANAQVLFPGARITQVRPVDTKLTQAQALLALLGRPNLPTRLTTNWISRELQVPWRDVSKHIMPLGHVQKAIRNLGWTYVSRKGCKGSYFEKTPSSIGTLIAA